MNISAMIAAMVGRVPTGAWVLLAVADLVATVLTWSVARRRMRRAGERSANPQLAGGATRRRDTALTVASMIPAALFWAMVLAGSLHGLVSFGRSVLGWHAGWEYLVPGTLDGVSVTFAFLAFRAVRMKKAPDRCYRVVWGAAIASATVNFAYEYTHSGHNVIAGGYLALLSLFGMVMLHEFLDQFEEGTAYVKRGNPKFGARWITWPTNTFCAAVAWRNYPPAEGTSATILNAIANLERARAIKQAAHEAKIVTRHQQALAAARRREELQAAKTGLEPSRGGTAEVEAVVGSIGAAGLPPSVPAEPVVEVPEEVPMTTAAIPPALPAPPKPGSQDVDDARVTRMRVPATAGTVMEWASLWVRMCADGESVLGPLNDDDARALYGLTAKQLRNIRNAATSGALRQKAIALGAELPPGYVDNPAGDRANGHDMTGAAA
ncbi:hypothetical protein [Actinoplanes subtropicus]|uniref:hypothetical protein n=1 Tax=Actinoplanes subtropicus TaxID=543632 RepID=UPI000AADA8CA|nr:hypothetical protein [Actinoplanes subtropicus]